MDGVLFDSFRLARENFLEVYPTVTDEMYREIFCGNFYDEVKKYLPVRIAETEEIKKIRQKEKAEPCCLRGLKNYYKIYTHKDIPLFLRQEPMIEIAWNF